MISEDRSQPMLRMSGIRKAFAGVEVLHGVDFELARGTIHALVGHNGAGKSTLMRVLGGVYPDYDGTVQVEGRQVTLRQPRQALDSGIAVIYQDFALAPDLDVAHNIALGREPRRAGRSLVHHKEIYRRSAEEAQRCRIDLPMRTPVGRLGVASQQLTEIVRALARDARILVMDEPTARLAPAEREQLFVIMRSLTERGVGVIYISHFLDEVVEVADDITVLRDGRVVDRLNAAGTDADELARLLIGSEEPTKADILGRGEVGKQVDPALDVRGLAIPGRGCVDLSAYPGEIVALAGLAGSGRTRLLRALIGDARATGKVHVDGRLLSRNSPARAAAAGMLLVPEDRKVNGLVLAGSIRQNIELTSLRLSLKKAGFVRRRARDAMVQDGIDRFDIRPPDGNARVDRLSGGNAQKVLFARAVSAAPKVLLLDQPTAGVDVGAKAEIHQRIFELAANGTAILVVSDDLDELIALAHRILIVVDGVVVGERLADETDRHRLLAAISKTSTAPAVSAGP